MNTKELLKKTAPAPIKQISDTTFLVWFWHEINSFDFCLPQKLKTENKIGSTFSEYIIWCPAGFYFGAFFISDIYCRSILFELWSRFCKLYWWHHSLYCGQDFSSIINVLGPKVNTLKIRDSIITSSSSEELFGGLIDSEPAFYDHIA